MISAIKKGKNECFIGSIQYLFNKKWDKYLPDKIIKDYFYYSYKGISLKSVKDNIHKIGGKASIHYALPEEVRKNKWYMAMIERDGFFHYLCIKKDGKHFKAFDPGKGETTITLEEEFVLLDIDFDKEFIWMQGFDFKNTKTFGLSMLFVGVISTFLAISLSFYFKFALIAIQNKNIINLKSIIVIFGIIGLIHLLWIYVKNIILSNKLWVKMERYYKFFFSYLLDSNEKINTHFTKIQIYNSMSYGAEFLKYNMIEKSMVLSHLFLSFACLIVIFTEYPIMAIPTITFQLLTSLLTIIFKKKLFNKQEKIRINEIKIGDYMLKAIDNISLASGINQSEYSESINKYVGENIKLNKNNSVYNEKLSTKYSFIAWAFNLVISTLLFVSILKNNINLASGIYLITISTMLYTSLTTIWIFIFNRDVDYDSLNKFNDFVCIYTQEQGAHSYDASIKYKNKLEAINGHFQIKGENGIGKSTYLKLYCGVFGKTNKKRIYLSKDSKVFGTPKRELYNELNIMNYYLKHDFLSSGQQQIKNLMLVLEKDFDSLVIDEALSSVNNKIRSKVYKYIFNNYPNKTILIVDHNSNLKIPVIDIML